LEKTNYWNLLDTYGDTKDFKYLHGVEMEYFLLDENFQPVDNNEKLTELIDETYKIIKLKIDTDTKYCNKILNLEIGTEAKLKLRPNNKDKDKIKTIFIEIRQKKHGLSRSAPIDIIGKDTNLGTGNFITLELVTPPCANVKELKFWLKTILFSTQEACNKIGLKFLLLAGHPSIEKNYCGEHHHIGIKDTTRRIKIFNVLRLFIPYLTILSFSYFEKPKNKHLEIQEDEFKTKINNQFIRGVRLKNTAQIKPVAPFLGTTKHDFAESVNLDFSSCRMVDMYPFTDYNTLEVRIFDTQISIARTIASAVILQGICLLALDVDNTIVDFLNKILTKNLYGNLRLDCINKGLSSFQRARFYRVLQEDIKKACKFCLNSNKCDRKELKELKCNFVMNNELSHNLISLLLFPRRFIMHNKFYGETHNKITTKDSIKQILYLINPYLIKMNLNQTISLKVIERTLKAGFEPSMYWMIQYKKHESDLTGFYQKILNYQDKMREDKQNKWRTYYDPFLEIP